jgi:ParB-like chromosome segregation protein Spo0J
MTAEVNIMPAGGESFFMAAGFESSDPTYGLEHLPEADVPISTLVPGFCLRLTGTDPNHIRMLADAAGSVRLPSIVVQQRGSRIIDGMHRVEAAKLRHEENICARFIDCTDEEALVLSIKLNVLHGLPLSRADRISGAKRILAAHRDWSDRAVAAVAGLSAKTIASLRNRSTDDVQFHGKRLGRDGKWRPVSAIEGKVHAAEYIDAHPEAPLREVAREAGVSLGTVHAVRDRMRRGLDHAARESGRPATDPADLPTQACTITPGSHSQAPAQSASAHSASAHSASVLSASVGRQDSRRLVWSEIASKLANDPVLKYTEGGRAFLRWMASHSAQADEWNEFIDAIPAHWVREVSCLADSIGAEWCEFAARLKSKQAAAS